MRLLFALVVGLAVGALLALMWANTAGKRNAWPRATMTIAQQQLATLRRAVRDDRCDVATTIATLARLRASHDEFTPAFADGLGQEPGFRLRARAFATAVDTAIATPPADCRGLDGVVREIDAACEACHGDYR